MKIQMLLLSFLFSTISITSFSQSNPFDSVELVLEKNIYFDFGKHNITTSAQIELSLLADSCRSNKANHVTIEAHTDHIGNVENNLKLSKQRANSVKYFFLSINIPSAQILINNYGEQKPIANNKTEAGRQLNRRATIRLFRKKEMIYLAGQIVDKKTGSAITAKVIFHTKHFRDSIQTDTTGHFKKAIAINTVVAIDVFQKGYFFETKMLKTKSGKIPLLKIKLLPAIAGEMIALKNFYFVGGQAILLPKSKPELPKILKFMQLNKQTKIEIAGHINAPFRKPERLAKWEWNLSVNRAKLVYSYLIQNGIDSTLLNFKGYGNTQMRFPETNREKEMAQNRRVEIRILETGKYLSKVDK